MQHYCNHLWITDRLQQPDHKTPIILKLFLKQQTYHCNVHLKLITSHHVILVSVNLPLVEQCHSGCASQSGPGVWAATRRSPQDLYSAWGALGHGLLEASPSEPSAAGHLHNSKKTGLKSKNRIKNHTKLPFMQRLCMC